jgi:CubicO group peptidase (beta-lactamase class C family)
MMAGVQGEAEYQAALELLAAQIAGDMAGRTAPGLSIAVVQGGGPVWARGFGFADLAGGIPADADTIFAVGSITKLFTATMLMQLRDAGKLRLDDAVQDYLPDVKVPYRHAGAPPISFRHLATHTSGLTKDAPVPYWDRGEAFPPVDVLMEKLAVAEQPYPPGVQWKYSNLAVALLGFALQRIAGQSWDAWISERILTPLGMDGAAPRFAERQRPKLATGYARPMGDWPPEVLAHQDLGGISAGGSLHASVVDMAKFLAQQWAETPVVLKAASIAEMHRPVWLNEDWQVGQGIGWRVVRAADGSTRTEHGGGVHGFTCKAMVSLKDRLGVAVFTNGSDGMVGNSLATQALDLLSPVVRRIAARGEEKMRGPAEWARYAGRYRWVLGDAEIGFEHGVLSLKVPNGAAWEDVRLTPEGEDFRMHGGQVRGEKLRFVADQDGVVRRAWLGPHPYDRV